ncbi:hypothetical protein [Falsochrobactrum shanghaiense]|uniref:hypothetical protein n=1 Tax=Falsochrobactrum shanghaiense TaxID=2201899 RepID=UPI0011B2404D|nr:hypothetical protein [Falsochrobactrum shanghaiense]
MLEGDYGHTVSIGIDNRFDCVHRSDWYRVHRNPDSTRIIPKSGLPYDLGCGYQCHYHAGRRMGYRIKDNQGAIRQTGVGLHYAMRRRQSFTVYGLISVRLATPDEHQG